MKKIMLILSAFALIIVGCSNEKKDENNTVNTTSEIDDNASTDGKAKDSDSQEGYGYTFKSSVKWEEGTFYMFDENSWANIMFIPYVDYYNSGEDLSLEDIIEMYTSTTEDYKEEKVKINGNEVVKVTGKQKLFTGVEESGEGTVETSGEIDTKNDENETEEIEFTSYFIKLEEGVIMVSYFGDNVDKSIVDEVLESVVYDDTNLTEESKYID